MTTVLDFNTASAMKFGHNSSQALSFAIGANDFHAFRYWVPDDCLIRRLGLWAANTTAGTKYVLGIYNDDGTYLQANTKLGQTSEITATTNDRNYKIFDLQAPVTLVKDQIVWLSFHANASFTVETAYSNPAAAGQRYRTVTYAATLPATFGAFTTNAGGWPPIGAF